MSQIVFPDPSVFLGPCLGFSWIFLHQYSKTLYLNLKWKFALLHCIKTSHVAFLMLHLFHTLISYPALFHPDLKYAIFQILHQFCCLPDSCAVRGGYALSPMWHHCAEKGWMWLAALHCLSHWDLLGNQRTSLGSQGKKALQFFINAPPRSLAPRLFFNYILTRSHIQSLVYNHRMEVRFIECVTKCR